MSWTNCISGSTRGPAERLARLEAHAALVEQRDDLSIEQIGLLNLLDQPDTASARLMARNFHPWEGGEGKATAQYVASLVAKRRGRTWPGAKPRRQSSAWRQRRSIPTTWEKASCTARRRTISSTTWGTPTVSWATPRRPQRRSAGGDGAERAHLRHVLQRPAAGHDLLPGPGTAGARAQQDAQSIFRKLVEYGQTHLHDQVQIDYFAVSLPNFLVFDDDLATRNHIHCHYMMGLGWLGLQETQQAVQEFDAVLALRADHLGAHIHKGMA